MTYDDLVEIALALPEVEEGMSYGMPSVKRKGRFMFCLKPDGDTVAVKLDWDTRDRLLAESPEKYYLTPHYEGYPSLLARLEMLEGSDARALVETSWEDAPNPGKRRIGIK